jgi:hypothetical protein
VVTFVERAGADGERERVYLDAGQNPPEGVVVHYYLREAAGAAVKGKLGAFEAALVAVLGRNPQQPPPTRLGGKLASLRSVVGSADAVPTRQAYEVYREVAGRIDEQLAALAEATGREVAAFARLVRELEIPPLSP